MIDCVTLIYQSYTDNTFKLVLSYRVRIFIYTDSSYDRASNAFLRDLNSLLYKRIGLQRVFGMDGIRLHTNFEILGIGALNFETFPSESNMK